MSKYTSFNQHNDTFIANNNRTELTNLPPGAYELSYDSDRDILMFNLIKMNYDQLIDLPSTEYEHVMKEVNVFLNAETRARFKEYGFLYKRSFLLHGTHGTGKTCIVNRVGEKVVEKGGIILFNPHPAYLVMAFKVLDEIQPGRTTMVIFEEFEELLVHNEGELLSILDGEIQKDNIMYMATTNHFNEIPPRLKRPGRFATILEVKFPNLEARTVYLTQKLHGASVEEVTEWANMSENLSIDELKESVLSVKCLGNPLNETIERLLSTKQDVINNPKLPGEFVDSSKASNEMVITMPSIQRLALPSDWMGAMQNSKPVKPKRR